MRVIMNVLAIAICQGYPLGFFKESSRETPLFVPKNDKTAKSCAFLRRNGLQRVSLNKNKTTTSLSIK